MLGGILRRLATTGRVVLGFFLSECECPSSWDDEDNVEDKEDGWTLAWAMLTASESINVMAKIAAANDLLLNTMVFSDLRECLLANALANDEQRQLIAANNDVWVLVCLCVEDRDRGKKRFPRLFLNNKNGDWIQACHVMNLWLFQLPSSKA